ncbi:MAG TPA: hypothetical protein VII52_01890, partial [Gemmatimonadaceae bacterium]
MPLIHMPNRTVSSKSASLSRSEARKAVLGVKEARLRSAKKASAKKASSWTYKRYLGHFGSGT